MDNKNEVLIYEDKDGLIRVDVKFIDEDVQLTKYQQVTDIYATSIDYDPRSEITKKILCYCSK